jgi:hypothetical protein
MHDVGSEYLGVPRSLFWVLGSRGLLDGDLAKHEAHGVERVHESDLDGCVASDGTAGTDGRCDGRGCGSGRGGEAGNRVSMIRPTGLENSGAGAGAKEEGGEEEVSRDDASEGLALAVWWWILTTDSRQQRRARWICVK